MARQRYILLGHVLSAHGIRGEVLVRAYTDAPDDFARYPTFTVVETGRVLQVRRARATAKGIVVAFEGVDDRTAAEALRGLALQVERATLPDPGEREFYHADLIGLELRSPDGAVVGRIVTVANFGAGDLLEIAITGQKATEYVPFDDDFVPSVDVEKGFAVIDLSRLTASDADSDGSEESGA